MLLLGLLLLGATGAFVGLLIAENLSGGPEYTVTMFDNDIATMNTLSVFLAGLALALIFCLALVMVASASARHRRRGAKLRHVRQEAAQATAERDALAARASSTGGSAADDQAAAPAGRRRHRPHLFGH